MNTYSDKNRHPCGAVREGDWIVIAIHKNTLKNATELHPLLENYNGDDCTFNRPEVIDLDLFLDDVVGALNSEEEDGQTPITRALDIAIIEAVENGSEGVELGD